MNCEIVVEQQRNKVKECLQGVQQELDLSFSRIDNFLDSSSKYCQSYSKISLNIIVFYTKLCSFINSTNQTYDHQLLTKSIKSTLVSSTGESSLIKFQAIHL
ncbi:unnamed protein product [Paramecium octaurelia]|uniref:Uncharacterized protein n=1 Tax=Paramecium octaurelia TaxID=43137 RepID=A0A8S1YQA1_PAROT|nr:unnamed protein product [Paramecium octaurelia]